MMQYRVNTCRIDPLAADQMVRACILPGHTSGPDSMLCMYVRLPHVADDYERRWVADCHTHTHSLSRVCA